ncbi:MAG: hypothetical protein ACLPSL_02655 [Smithella sp.]
MGLLGRFFSRSARKLLEQMHHDTDVIQMAVVHKLFSLFNQKYGKDRGLTITAAVTNKLFSKVSPAHSKEDLELAEYYATDILKNDAEVRYAALMSCRAILLHEADIKSGNEMFVWDTIQWMATIWTLPPDEATPHGIRELATTLYNKYLQKK